MKVLLILLKVNSDCQWHVGLGYISAILKAKGYTVDLMEIGDLQKQLPAVQAKIKQGDVGVVGISANSHQFKYIPEVAAKVKEYPFSIPIIVGGVHTTLKPEAIDSIKEIDGVCIGEGEEAFLELVDKIAAGDNYFSVKNFWFRDGEKIVRNVCRPLTENLDLLPLPDRSIFNYFNSLHEKKVPRFIFSRGCPFECSYCCNHIFKRIYKDLGKYVRWRSVDSALVEIERTRKEYNFDYFKLDDDTFSLNKAWLKEFCEKLASKDWGLTFECNVRPGTIDEEGMELLKKGGCRMIKIGVETGNVDLRKSILNRSFSNEDIIKTFALAKKFGIKTFSFNMIGVPGETMDTVKESVDLNLKIKPDFMQVTAFYPYPGTVLGDLCFAKNLVGEEYEDSYMDKSILNLTTITKKEIEKSVKSFKFKIYWQYNKKMALQEKKLQLIKYIVSKPFLHYLARLIYKPIKLLKGLRLKILVNKYH
ncbi:radical SAM protein [Patescibacteria group bacterium]|nr:radical SAM protein [Patescibacteria group bacterium]